MRFGILGCGGIAATHAGALSLIPGVQLVAVADRFADRAAALADATTAEVRTPERLLRDGDIDAICICTPPASHADDAVVAADSGKHLVVEKPIDVTLTAADKIIDACRRNGVGLAVMAQHRFDRGVVRLRTAIQEGRLGRLTVGDAVVKWHRPQSYYEVDWKATRQVAGGGALINQGIHFIDLLLDLMGPIDSVTGHCATVAHDMDVEDVALGWLRFSSGAVGTVYVTTAAYPGARERIEISGERGTVVVEGDRVLRWSVDGEHDTGDEPEGALSGAEIARLMVEGHRRQLAEAVDAFRAGRDPLAGGAEGRAAVEVVDAIYRSARTGGEVRLEPARAVRR
jgi:UDP-N-acetyl-2-amino-2-deoxyglucuronate dehydrogenase